ncbi:DegV family protein [Arthrobacter castelli]|uniref:DegV family protein n=1 Tax=Arthrobacter castelli TaxID=271431 RepID=UPI00041956EE|nr:DegV family protein [Arthrobacter castelli]
MPDDTGRIAVVTDSAAALPASWVRDAAARGRFAVVPMPVMVDGDIFDEGVDDLRDALRAALEAGSPVRTSRPSPGQFSRIYGELAAKGITGIVSVHISASLSGTADTARLAASTAPVPVNVIDSRTVGMAQGYGVQAALAVAEASGTMEAAAAAARQACGACSVYFYVPSLEQLRRGGRVGAAASWLGTVLSIKPILGLRDGTVVPVERVRSTAKAVSRLEELALAASGSNDAARWAVHHFDNRQPAQELSIRLGLRSGAADGGQLTTLPAVLAAHTGLGTLGVVVPGPATDTSSTTEP